MAENERNHMDTTKQISANALQQFAIDRGRSRARDTFLSRLANLGSATAHEIALGAESVRKRASELVADGTIERIGTRICTLTHRVVSIYRIARQKK